MSAISSRKIVPPLASSTRPFFCFKRTGEGAAFMAEQFAFQQHLGIAAQLIRMWRAAPMAQAVEAPATSSFAGAAFEDERAGISGSHGLDELP